MNVLSLFDGMSCGRIALERANISIDRYYASEIDKYAISITQKNYPDTVQLGDVYDIDYSELPKIDMVIGGSPCTHWSIAKKDREVTSDGLGFDLFMQFVRAVKETGCRYFIYENNYSIHKDIKHAISEKLGVNEIMINSALVSAQNRKRCYWTNIPGVCQPEDRGILLEDILEEPGVIWHRYNQTIIKDKSYTLGTNPQCLTAKTGQTIIRPIRLGEIGNGGQGQRIYSVKGKSVNLTANGGGQGAKTGLYKIDLPDGEYLVRKLTTVECERLQTVPDNYTEGVSNTQRYRMLGNGWTVDVIAHILSFIKQGS